MIISLDTETTGIDFYHGAKPFLVTTCDENMDVTYWEWDVNPLTREPLVPKDHKEEIKELIYNAEYIVGQNLTFDFKALKTVIPDIEIPWGRVRDTLIAGHLLSSNTPHDLTSMAMQYLKVNVKKYELALKEAVNEARRYCRSKLKNWMIGKEGLECMPSAKEKTWRFDYWLPRAVARYLKLKKDHPWWTILSEYANSDSAVTLPLYEKQMMLIKRRRLQKIYDERLKILPMVFGMQNRGIVLNRPRKEKLRNTFTSVSEKCRQVCLEIAGGDMEDLPVNGTSNALKSVVFDKLKLESNRKTPKGAPSMDKFVLDHWLATLEPESDGYKFVKSLRDYRKRKTALSYMQSYDKFGQPLNGDQDWVLLHPSLNPTGTDTLRWSSSGPNEQQISKLEDSNLRYCFGPGPGREWWSLDAKNIELRIPAYESGEKELIGLFEEPDKPPYYGSEHLLNFSTVYPDLWDQELKEVGIDKVGPTCKKKYASTWYQWCKNGGFAVQYGAVDRTDKEGTADRAFHRRGSHAKLKSRFNNKESLNQKWIKFAERTGYVETVPDRSVDPDRGYPLMCTRSKWGGILPTVPLSYHVQGTAMWVMTRMMNVCQEVLDEVNVGLKPKDRHFMVIQVHDEIVLDFPFVEDHGNLGLVEDIKGELDKVGHDLVPSMPLIVGIEYHKESWAESEVFA